MSKVLIAGSTGYIGRHLTRILAATQPSLKIYALSRQSPSKSAQNDPYTAAFTNVQFIQGDCLEPEQSELAEKLEEVDTVVHSVGAITDQLQYKKLFAAKNP